MNHIGKSSAIQNCLVSPLHLCNCNIKMESSQIFKTPLNYFYDLLAKSNYNTSITSACHFSGPDPGGDEFFRSRNLSSKLSSFHISSP
jgi:hypothetical protein